MCVGARAALGGARSAELPTVEAASMSMADAIDPRHRLKLMAYASERRNCRPKWLFALSVSQGDAPQLIRLRSPTQSDVATMTADWLMRRSQS